MVILPHPRRDIPIGTARSIYKQAGCNKRHTLCGPDPQGRCIRLWRVIPRCPWRRCCCGYSGRSDIRGCGRTGFCFWRLGRSVACSAFAGCTRQDRDFILDSADAVVAAIRPSQATMRRRS